jgi:hypothetical protein
VSPGIAPTSCDRGAEEVVSSAAVARRSGLALLALLALACGPVVDPGEVGGSGSSSSSGAGSSGAIEGSSTAPVPGSSSGDGADDSTTVPDPGGYEEDDGGTGCTFTCPDPPPPTPPPNSAGWCGLDCPRGEKCMPWANDGGMAWNSFRCSPLDDEPNAPGEPCSVEGSQWSGIDDCEEDAICWQVDPRTNEGVCHAACNIIDDGTAVCPDPQACAILDAGVPLCVQSCEPLSPSCPQGQTCTFTYGGLACQIALGDTVQEGQPCGPEVVCELGTLCSYEPALDCTDEPGVGCCAEPCDLNDPSACNGTEVCLPWFPLRPPPELAYLGVCAAP